MGLRKDGSKYVCPKCKKQFLTQMSNKDCQYSDCPAKPQQEEEESVPERKKAKSDVKFHREHGVYICNYCSKKCFTKVEVEQCYDSHFQS